MNDKVCHEWPVRRQIYGYLPSHGASPLFGHKYQIILLGEPWHMYVNNLLKVVCYLAVLWLELSRSWDFSVTSLARYRYTTKPLALLLM